MIVKIELLEDTIFGSGESIPGAEDLSVTKDEDGYPYYKGSAFKGVFREELENYLCWTNKDTSLVNELLGKEGHEVSNRTIYFSDFVIPYEVKKNIHASKEDIFESCTTIKAFTALENGVAKEGSLRKVRCVKKGLCFYGTIECLTEDEELIKEVLPFIKWIGTKRTRGFGKIKVTVE